jgi:hypothetical protein
MASLKNIIDNTKNVYQTSSSLSSLLDFERVIDELDIYAYKNWMEGEIVEGPIHEKYFVTVTLMWPYKMMPDPTGAERLSEYDCFVRFRRSALEAPVKIESQDDYQPGGHYPKTKKYPVWLVEITMPKSLMSEIYRGSVELEGDVLNAEDLEDSYETGADQQEVTADVAAVEEL